MSGLSTSRGIIAQPCAALLLQQGYAGKQFGALVEGLLGTVVGKSNQS
ncbi:MAG: hypothetical protein H6639_01055 [Caldilineaceae bacterium]|nr:hypothetical protein [Caldilineaceae bacterium]